MATKATKKKSSTPPKKAAVKPTPKKEKPSVIKRAVRKVKKVVDEIKEQVAPIEQEPAAENADDIALAATPADDLLPPTEPMDFHDLMAHAWERVRGDGDPSLDNCAPDFVATLETHARAALRGSVAKGDMILSRFERAVSELRQFYKGD